MADAHESAGDGVQEEATEELRPVQRHGARSVAVGVILVAEGDGLVIHRHQSAIGDGDAVRVTREVLENLLGSAEGRLGVDHPVALDRGVEQSVELGVVPGARELAAGPRPLEQVDELASEDLGEHPHRQEEPALAGDPA